MLAGFVSFAVASDEAAQRAAELEQLRARIQTLRESLDSELGRRDAARVAAALDEAGGEMLITADHGNVEQLHDPATGQAHTAHTTNLVPFVYYGARAVEMTGAGVLSDIAPSLLVLLGMPQPAEMTGKALLRLRA